MTSPFPRNCFHNINGALLLGQFVFAALDAPIAFDFRLALSSSKQLSELNGHHTGRSD
jgi:hypothetical protein